MEYAKLCTNTQPQKGIVIMFMAVPYNFERILWRGAIIVEYFLTFLEVLWLAYRLGKEDGKWGCFTFLVIIILIGVIGTAIK